LSPSIYRSKTVKIFNESFKIVLKMRANFLTSANPQKSMSEIHILLFVFSVYHLSNYFPLPNSVFTVLVSPILWSIQQRESSSLSRLNPFLAQYAHPAVGVYYFERITRREILIQASAGGMLYTPLVTCMRSLSQRVIPLHSPPYFLHFHALRTYVCGAM
jgi:hypothetical protein